MFSKLSLRKLFLCLTLYAGAMMGSPMRPEEIEDLMRTMHRTAIVQRLSEEDDDEPAEPVHPER